jgi:ABC-type transport system substrate-binding protein
MAINVSSPSSDVGVMARYFSSANFSPNGFNFEQWKDDEFDKALAMLAESSDPETIARHIAKRTSASWTIRRGCSSSTISIRAR